MSAPRVTLKIDRLKVAGAAPGDAAALADGLRAALQAQLSVPGGVTAQSMEHLSLRLPQPAGYGPSALGRQVGHRIAGALNRPKGGG